MIKIWDKKESINGIDAEIVLNNRPELKNEDVILIINEQGNVTNIELPSILKSNLNLSGELSVLKIGESYIKYLEEQNNKVAIEKESYEKRIETLENTILQMQGVI